MNRVDQAAQPKRVRDAKLPTRSRASTNRAFSSRSKRPQKILREGTCEIEVIDLLQNAELAKLDPILANPTLVRKLPERIKRVIGDLSNADRALLFLDFPRLQGP
jgi:hypothetical protein